MASNRGDLTGKTLGTCVLERLVGQGGMGAVYLAQQTRPARRVAVKVLLPNTAMSADVYEAFLARFRREADVIAKLEHVNIMPIYEYGEQDNLAYLVMPYLAGGSLRDVLIKRGSLSLAETATYMDQAASALDYAHAQGVVHRDLKPANFLLAADGRLVLADFGIARIMEDTSSGAGLTSTGMIIGTPEYMAPEMVNGEQVDYRADIYELGVVLFQMLSGSVPFKGNTPIVVITKHMREALPSLHQLNPDVPAAVDAIIQKATAKKREERYTSVSAFARAFRTALTQPSTAFTADIPNRPIILPPPPTGPMVIQATQNQYNTPAQQSGAYYNQGDPTQPQNGPYYNQDNRPNLQQSGAYYNQGNQPQNNTYGNYQSQQAYPSYSNTPPVAPPYQESAKSNLKPLLIILSILVALVLVVSSVSAAVYFSKPQTAGVPASIPTTDVQQSPTVAPTKGTTPTPTATTQPTAVPTTKPTTVPTVQVQPALIPTGPLLYSAQNPGKGCDLNGATWTTYNNIQITCQNGQTILKNALTTLNLSGTFLAVLPGKAYPQNYVIQVQIQQNATSSANFGIYFRNQPGNSQGAYTFLVHPDGSWEADVYDNATGKPTQLTNGKGNFGDIHALTTLDIVANGNHFTFYANGTMLGSADDPASTYAAGTTGIALDQNATVNVSNFELYTPA